MSTTMEEFTCLICELEFPTGSRLQQHFRLYHRKRKLVTCGFCKMMFVKKKTCFELSDEIMARRCRYIDQLGAAYSRKKDLCSPVALPVVADGSADGPTTVGPGPTGCTAPAFDSTGSAN